MARAANAKPCGSVQKVSAGTACGVVYVGAGRIVAFLARWMGCKGFFALGGIDG